MLGKLLKHEFHATGRIMLPMLGALALLAGMANLSFRGIEYTDSAIVNLVLGFVIVLFFLGLFAAAVLSVVIVVYRFYKNLLRDEGYLMFTLPVSVHSLVWSKLIAACCWLFLTGLVCTGLMLLTVFHLAADMGLEEILRFLPYIGESVRKAIEQTALTTWDLVGYGAELLLVLLTGCMSQCLLFYAAMAVGHSFSKNKMLLSIVFYIAIRFGLMLLRSLFGLAADQLHLDSVILYEQGEMLRFLHGFMLNMGIQDLLQSALLYLLTVLPLQKRLNLN